ncbi:multiple sugar transport system substrate-binding protein [Streptosporangium becharense]|uniref:Multiple sugar transport system substrate-binding protein n=1 Tax=Streptosporangium becharense TaxID=1816182 RepID=A0A7W9IIZ0_9ACTN|nr:ABC transporter substrate-binding protein [Streptosporangium becharense]MBB2911355.1 multiple sugar transport system substrate-binding protein [Streptosporangium becharense]MBB5821587.1 multiple sugar transport system substrate-binding protein [Streptosporangium becharense]
MGAVHRITSSPSRREVLRGGALAFAAMAGATVSGCASGTDDGAAAGGPVTIELWHGQTDTGRDAIERLVADFQRAHPDIKINAGGGVLADAMLQKVTAALAADSYPDIAYVFGSDLANVARSPQVADLTDMVNSAPTPWTEYWAPTRAAVTIDGKVKAAPALIDSLAVVCNKKVFEKAGVDLPEEGWTWQEFTETAKRLTDKDNGTFGTGWPGTGDEDTVWRMWPLIWDLGGDVIAPGGREIGFASTGERALEVLRTLAADASVYVDPKPGSEQMYKVFLAGRMGMVVTGPWQLPDIVGADIDYQVVPLPSFSGKPITISGPDTWTVFDNGEARLKAARTFITWLMQPEQDVRWDVEAGSLPLSKRTQNLPAWSEQVKKTEGLSVFVKTLETARVRPNDPAYPHVSKALGEAVVAVLIGKSTPADALRDCAAKANTALRVPR